MSGLKVRLRCSAPNGTDAAEPRVLVRTLSTLPRRLVTGARFRGKAAFHFYCFQLATAPHDVGAYQSLSSIPEGVPIGIMLLLAAVIILRTTHAGQILHCRNDTHRRIVGIYLRSVGIGG
jgi:hypothetical protein